MVSAMKTAGICMIVLAVAVFFAIPFMIIYYGPVWSGLVFVFVALMACGAVIVGRASIRKLPDEFTEERHVEPRSRRGWNPRSCPASGADTAPTAALRCRRATSSAVSAGRGCDHGLPRKERALDTHRDIRGLGRRDDTRAVLRVPFLRVLPVLPRYIRMGARQR